MEKKKKQVTRPAQITLVLRLIAGVYLICLAYGLAKEVFVSSGGRQILQIACGLLFLAVGAALAGWSLAKLARGEFARPGQGEGDFND